MNRKDKFWRPRINLPLRRQVMKIAQAEHRGRDPSYMANILMAEAIEARAKAASIQSP